MGRDNRMGKGKRQERRRDGEEGVTGGRGGSGGDELNEAGEEREGERNLSPTVISKSSAYEPNKTGG